jgi:hypothetical protein
MWEPSLLGDYSRAIGSALSRSEAALPQLKGVMAQALLGVTAQEGSLVDGKNKSFCSFANTPL